MKTPEQIAASAMLDVMEYVPLDDDSMSHWTRVILNALESDRAQFRAEAIRRIEAKQTENWIDHYNSGLDDAVTVLEELS